MAEPLKKDEALAAAVREAFQRHMEAARLASQAAKEKQPAPPSASLRSFSPAVPTARDPRLAVPTPANEARATPASVAEAAPPALKPAVPAPKAETESISLSRLVTIASPQRALERPVENRVIEAPVTEAPTVEAPEVEAPKPVVHEAAAPTVEVAPAISAVDSLLAEAPLPAPPVTVPTQEAPVEIVAGDDGGLDFGEALFIEIAPEAEKPALAEPPKMPKAASLDTPMRGEPLSQIGADDLEFRQPPLRERPRMSTASETAGPPQDLDLIARAPAAVKAAPAEAKAPAPRPAKVADLPPATGGKNTTRFGMAIPVRPAAAVAKAKKYARFGKPGKFRIPTTLVASVALTLGIAGIGSYFWSHPDSVHALSALVAPPSPTETKVAVAAPDAKAPAPDAKIDGSVRTTQTASAPPASPPTTQLASVPNPPAGTIAPLAIPEQTPPAATRSVSTVAITLDGVDEAVQSARELTAMGDIDGARQALDSYKNGSDPRALFALAETYDPSVVKDPSKADPAQAKILYEAAAKAGSQDNTADRIARLALAHTN